MNDLVWSVIEVPVNSSASTLAVLHFVIQHGLQLPPYFDKGMLYEAFVCCSNCRFIDISFSRYSVLAITVTIVIFARSWKGYYHYF